ncbi:MAG: hypothetical protein JSR53_14820 [Proteobacteria bacterium]|nr:hypothetical protein [Pseudomonadota bacterium]
MNARIETLQLAATADIAPSARQWLEKLYAMDCPSATATVPTEALFNLLSQYRQELSGLFSRDDLLVLLNGLFQSRYEPNELHRLATDICDDMGVEIDEAEQSSLWPLLERLFSLTKGQSVALIDALQLALAAEVGPTECWKALGIELKAL